MAENLHQVFADSVFQCYFKFPFFFIYLWNSNCQKPLFFLKKSNILKSLKLLQSDHWIWPETVSVNILIWLGMVGITASRNCGFPVFFCNFKIVIVMSVRLPVGTKPWCRKAAILVVFTTVSLITVVLIDVYVQAARCLHALWIFRAPRKTCWSGFWTTQLGPSPDDPLIDLTAISTFGRTTLSLAVKIA